MNEASHYANKTPEELCRDLSKADQGGFSVRAEVVGALATVLTKNLTDTIHKHEQAATKLSNQLLILNIILGIFTVVGTIIAVCQFFG